MLNIRDLPKSFKIKNGIKDTKYDFKKSAIPKPENIPEYIIHDSENDIVNFTIKTKAIPKGRPRIFIDEKKLIQALGMGIKGLVHAKKSVSLKTPKETREYEKYIAHIGLLSLGKKQILDGVFGIEVSISNPRQFSDIDNCLKAVMDGLNGIAYKDDKKVRKASIEFSLDEPSVHVRVYSMEA